MPHIGPNGKELDQELALFRARLRMDIHDEIGDLCEWCNYRPWTDINEVYILRNDMPRKRQDEIFVRENCAALCRTCHKKFHGQNGTREDREKFKTQHRMRLIQLGYEPMG